MSQAIVDPAELRRFASLLREFTNELQGRLVTVNTQLNSLSQTWRDQEHLKFADEFSQHLKLLARFIEANETHVPYLLRKAERIEEYLSQK
ncbi:MULTISPECIES: WXG100 family type VII secretion target [unclassified Schlesneria]|uniref:WXG100 family type VII secretion target n=1 Tax=Schlesneria TaxID=656899 RepID=UPI002EEAD4E6